MRVGDLTLHPEREEVTLKGAAVDLTGSEYTILEHLAANAGRVISSEELATQLWGPVGAGRGVQVHVSRLRNKLAAVDGHRKRITTRRGAGYRYNPSEERVQVAAVTYTNSHGVEWAFLDTGYAVAGRDAASWSNPDAERGLTHSVLDKNGVPIGLITVWLENTHRG